MLSHASFPSDLWALRKAHSKMEQCNTTNERKKKLEWPPNERSQKPTVEDKLAKFIIKIMSAKVFLADINIIDYGYRYIVFAFFVICTRNAI